MSRKEGRTQEGRRARLAHAGTCVPALLLLALTGCGSRTDGSQSTAPALPPCVTPAGSVVTLLQGNVSGLATRGQEVFATSDNKIDKLPLTGSKPTLLASTSYVSGLALLGNRAYFTSQLLAPPDAQGKQSSESTLASVPLSGGKVTTVIASHPPLVGESLQASDGTSLYFGQTSHLWSIDKLTPPATTLASYPLSGKAFVTSIALHDGYVYAAEYSPSATAKQGGIQRVSTSGGTPEVLIKDIGIPRALVVDNAHLYFSEDPASFSGTGRIARAGLDGSHVTTLVHHGALSMVVAGGRLYYAVDNNIFSVPVSGGTPKLLVQGKGELGMLRVSGGNLLWVDPVVKAMSDPTVPKLQTTCL